jgi:hypothetical protein
MDIGFAGVVRMPVEGVWAIGWVGGSQTIGYTLSGLKMIRIPSSVDIIGRHYFFQCRSLYEVILEWKVEVIESDAFLNCPLRCVKIPHGVKLNHQFPIGCRIDTLITFDWDFCEYFCKISNRLINKFKQSLHKQFHILRVNERIGWKMNWELHVKFNWESSVINGLS